MGIPKLNRFMLNCKGWDTIQVSGNVVIDGNALCYNLHSKHEWKHGGDYREFYETIIKYIRELKVLGIEPYVVLDGMDHDNSKHKKYVARNEERINKIAKNQATGEAFSFTVLPLFIHSVFADALRDSEAKFFVADGEADQDIAALANSLSCPVISNDADFYIFNIEGGYIPLISDKETRIDLSKPVKYFQYKEFDTSFNWNHDQRLFFPFIRGNDFHSGTKPSLGITQRTPLKDIAGTIGTLDFSTANLARFACIDNSNPASQMEDIKSYYRGMARSFDDLSSISHLVQLYPHTPEWVMREYKNGRFMASIMSLATCPTTKRWRYKIVIEDFSKESAWKITEVAQKFIIGTLLGEETSKHKIMTTVVSNSSLHDTQHYRSGEISPFSQRAQHRQSYRSRDHPKLTLVDTEVVLSPEHKQILPVPLSDHPAVPVATRQEIIHRVFQYVDSAKTAIPEELQLAVIATRYWVCNVAQDNMHLIRSLVCCILTCYGQMPMVARVNKCELTQEEKLLFLHSFAQWQCLLYYVIAFNQVLGHPFLYTSPAKLFSSQLLVHYYQQTQEALLEVENTNTMAKSIIQVITSHIGAQKDSELEPPTAKRQCIKN